MNEMQVSVENTGRLNRRLSVIVPINQLEQTKKNRLGELAKQARLDGFRPGKVPVTVIEKLYGDSIWGDVIQESLQVSLTSALRQNSLNPAGQPHIESVKAEPGNDLEYTASFEIYPVVKAPQLTSIRLEKLNVSISETDIDEVLAKMRLQHADWIEVPRKAQYGDKVRFNLVFAEGGEVRKDLEWVLDQGTIPVGFESLLASSAGENLTILLPNDKEEGKVISATLQIQKITEPQLAKLDETFAKQLGVREGGIEAVRTQIRQHMQSELARVLRENLKTQVIDKLMDLYAIDDLPQALLEQEIQRLETDTQNQKAGQGNQAAKRENLLHIARRRLTLGLLFSALIEEHHLQVDETRVQQEIKRLANAFQFEQSVEHQIYKNQNMMRNIRSSILEEQVIDKLLEDIEYTEKTMDYKDVMNFKTNKSEETLKEDFSN
jgi:trigger factor